MKIYCDTSTLPHNVERCAQQQTNENERIAIQQELVALEKIKKIYPIYTSSGVLREAARTKCERQREYLVADQRTQTPIALDEKVLGFHSQGDQYGGFITSPLVSDIQNQEVYEKLVANRIKKGDASLIAQALSNACGVFLTIDKNTIIKRRDWLQKEFPILKIRRPSELLKEIEGYSDCNSAVSATSIAFQSPT